MDYKYIEQLLDGYFKCRTTLEEERILQAFFRQEEVPEGMEQYRALFAEAGRGRKDDTLGVDFDARLLALVGEENLAGDGVESAAIAPLRVKVRRVPLNGRLRPLYKAAACVAVVLAVGQAAQVPYERRAAEMEVKARITHLKENAVRKDSNAVAHTDTVASKTVERERTRDFNAFR